jgi:MFS family permease
MNEPTNSSAIKISKTQWLVLIAAFLGWMFDGVEIAIFPVVARPALQELLGTQADQHVGPWMGYITALFLLGAAGGGLLFGWLGDKIGRVRAMIASILTYSVFTGVCYFAQAPWQLGVFRFVAALGMGGEWALGVALVMECWPESKRPLMSGIIGSGSNFGLALVGIVTWIFPVRPDSWRWVMVAGAVPAVLALWIAVKVPESHRWQEAVKTRTTHPLAEVFGRKLWATTLLAIGLASVILIGTWGSVQWMLLWADQMAGKTLPQAKSITLLLLAFGAIVGCFIGAALSARLGRRPAYFAMCVASLLSCGFLFRTVTEFGPTFLIMSLLVGIFTASFYGWLPLYLPELFPTRARATGQGVCFNGGRALAAIGAITQGQLVLYYDGSYAKAGSVLTLVYLVGMVLIWFGPETKGKPLPE